MAEDWIPMRCELADEPEVIRIAAAVGLDEDTVVGKLHRLWSWASRRTEDGNAAVTLAWVDKYLRCDGFAAAMVEVKWLNAVDALGIQFPKFDRFNSQSAKRRALTANRVASHRGKTPQNGNGAVTQTVTPTVTQQALPITITRTRTRKGGETPPNPPGAPPPADRFEAWWATVHFKTAKDAARRAYANAVKRLAMGGKHPDPHGFLLDRMRQFAASPSAAPPDRTPIHPATWLNQGRYDDDPATWERTPASGRNGHDSAVTTRRGAPIVGVDKLFPELQRREANR